MARGPEHTSGQVDAPEPHAMRVGGIPCDAVEPLWGMPIRCRDLAGAVVDVTLMTRLGIVPKGVRGIVDRGDGDAVEARYRLYRRLSDVAQVIACYLRCHPKVEAVAYPGLKDDPSFAVAARTLVGGFGPFVDFRVAGRWLRFEAQERDERSQVMDLERLLAGLAC